MTLPKSVIEAKQSLAEMQQMILSVFSCVAYIRYGPGASHTAVGGNLTVENFSPTSTLKTQDSVR